MGVQDTDSKWSPSPCLEAALGTSNQADEVRNSREIFRVVQRKGMGWLGGYVSRFRVLNHPQHCRYKNYKKHQKAYILQNHKASNVEIAWNHTMPLTTSSWEWFVPTIHLRETSAGSPAVHLGVSKDGVPPKGPLNRENDGESMWIINIFGYLNWQTHMNEKGGFTICLDCRRDLQEVSLVANNPSDWASQVLVSDSWAR